MWLAKDEDGVTARMSMPAYFDRLFSPIQCNQGTFLTGDHFDILNLPNIPNIRFSPDSLGSVVFRRLYFGGSSPLRYVSIVGTPIFIQCSIDGIVRVASGAQAVMTDCQIGGPSFGCIAEGGVYCTQGLYLNTVLANAGRLGISNYVLLQNCKTYVENNQHEATGGGVFCHSRGFGVYDSPDSGIVIPHGQIWYIEGSIYGLGNTSHPIEVQRGGKMFLDNGSVPTLTGGIGLSDILLGQRDNGPAVDPTTWAYTANRAYSFANLAASVTAGGFGGNIFDPLNPSTAIVIGD